MTVVFRKGGHLHTETGIWGGHPMTMKMAITSQERPGTDPSLTASEGTDAADTLILDF